MKINITQLPTDEAGYINVNTMSHSIYNLDGVCEDAECTEIVAEVLDYVHAYKLLEVLKHWVSKLRHGGKIILGGTDILEVARLVVNGTMPISEANKAFYGEADLGCYIKSGVFNCGEMCTLLKELGLVVDKKRVNGTKFVVEAHRE